jgi:hypothetical protein
MRLDLPDEVPRRRASEGPGSAPPLAPSPVERRRESLAARAADRRNPKLPIAFEKHRARGEPSRTPEKHPIPRERKKDQRPRRQEIPQQAVGLSLRDEERKVLMDVGRFRVINTCDLAETVYNGRHSRMERDLAFLREKGLVTIDSVNARRDGRGGRVERIEVVTLTKSGRDVAHHISDVAPKQRLYAGLVKPREVEHDTQIYRAYGKESERIKENGGTNLRVKLDFELKSEVQKAIHAARKADPNRDMSDIKRGVAQQFELPYVNDGIQIPDARIEYDLPQKDDQDRDQGTSSGHQDIEVLTAAYRPGHLRNKAQAGFHLYASSSDRATLTGKIEDDHHLMENILEL